MEPEDALTRGVSTTRKERGGLLRTEIPYVNQLNMIGPPSAHTKIDFNCLSCIDAPSKYRADDTE